MLVSQTSAKSCLSSAALSLTKPNRCFEPHSSSPSIIMVIGSGSCPVTALKARQRLDEGHHLAFVVAGAARDDDLAAVGQSWRCAARTAASPTARADRPAARRSGRRTARAAPCRCRAVAGFADHDRMARRSGACWSSKPMLARSLATNARPRPALVLVGRVGRDRLDAQESNSRSRLSSSSASIRSRTAGSAAEAMS